MTKKTLTLGLLLTAFLGASAQKDTAAHAPATPPPIAITGSIDGYYRYNFEGGLNNLTSFTNSTNSFELGMASIRGDHSFGKGSVVVDLGFGRRAAEFSYNDVPATSLAVVKQMYATYQASSKVKFTFGKWATHVGYEVMDAYGNRNYSTSYMFTYGPFFHTGVKADFVTGKKSAFMIGIANPTDFSTTTSSSKYLIAQYSTATSDDKWKVFVNYQGTYGGSAPKSLTQFDVVVNGTLNSQWGIGYNGTYGGIAFTTLSGSQIVDKTLNWFGSALYLNYDPTPKVGYTFRGEYFSDKDGVKGLGADFMEYTLTAQWKIDNCLTIMPEIRLDNASIDGPFTKADGSPVKSTLSALVAAVYKF